MIDFILGVLVGWWTLPILGLIALITTHNDSEGWAFIFTILAAVTTYFVFDISLVMFFTGLALYIPIGIVWSVFRWRRYVRTKVQEFNEMLQKDAHKINLIDEANKNDYKENVKRRQNMEYECLQGYINPRSKIDEIVFWIMIWPFSFVDEILGDILDAVATFIKTKIIGIYDKVAYNAIADLEYKHTEDDK